MQKETAHKNANKVLQVSIEDIAVVCKAAFREQGSACKTADRKADGCEKPASQKTAGGPVTAHAMSCARRAWRSRVQAVRPLPDV